MIDPNPLPSRQLRITASMARWALKLLLAFWLLLIGVGVVLHGFIVPRISNWGGHVERLASDAIGIPVKVGAISAHSEGLFPTVELSQLQLLNPAGETALLLPRVVVTLSAKSLLRLGIEQLYIESASLSVRRLVNGEWHIAGIPSTPSNRSDHNALEWLLTQPELALKHGSIDFVDEKNGAPPASLTNVNIVLRHHGWRHQIRVDATPTNAPEQALQLMGDFQQPLLPSKQAVWQRWSGQWYASTSIHQVPALPWPESWQIDTVRGAANARFWLDISKGRFLNLTTDIALSDTSLAWVDQQLPPFDLKRLQGRLSFETSPQGWHVSASNFSFTQSDDKQWPSSDWAIRTTGTVDTLEKVQGSISYADLSMASSVLQALPVPAQLSDTLGRWQPHGELRAFKFSWNQANTYQASGQFRGVSLREQVAEHGVGTPGVQGLNGNFQLHENGGQAQLAMEQGSLILPGVFEEMSLPLEAFSASVEWQRHGAQWQVDVPEASFANADAAGQLHASWQTGQNERPRFPGSLKLSGALDRADGARVFRYLPLAVPEVARHYVRDTVLQGQGKNVKFEVQGNLQDMPFTKPGSGRFYIEAPVNNVIFNFIPSKLRSQPSTAWPALEKLSGTLVFEGNSMEVRQAATSFTGHPKFQMASVSASIPDLSHPQVKVRALGHSDLDTLLHFVASSPLAEITAHALDNAKASKEATLSFELNLPIADLKSSQVTGRLGLKNNALHLDSHIPPIENLQGSIHFHSQGFSLENITGKTLGGSVSILGGMKDSASGVDIRAQGIASAEGLQQANYLPAVSEIAQHALGKSSYDLEIKARQGEQFIRVQSNLQGLEIKLPPPFDKVQENPLPLTVTQTVFDKNFQEVSVQAGTIGQLRYLRNMLDSTPSPLRGKVVIGAPLPPSSTPSNFSTSINLEKLDLDAWLQLLDTSIPTSDNTNIALFLPENIQIKIVDLKIKNNNIRNFSSFAQKKSNAWAIHAESDQFKGDFEYHQKNENNISGMVFARLSHLLIDKNQGDGADSNGSSAISFQNLPELDIQIDSFNIAETSLGKLELKAKNRSAGIHSEWILEKFNLTTPESKWQAEGVWKKHGVKDKRETSLTFTLDTQNAGQLLERFGMHDVIRDGQGKLNGQIGWMGSPVAPALASLTGNIHLEVGKGQFLKVEPGMGKLLSVLSLQSITRRINLDFRDIFSQGFSFDFIRGDLQVRQGIATTNNLQMKGLNAAVFMEGSANLKSEHQDLKLIVVPEINAMTASLAAAAINPVIGLGSFFAQMLLRAPLMEAATRSFHIYGSWYEPTVDPIKNSASASERIPSLAKP